MSLSPLSLKFIEPAEEVPLKSDSPTSPLFSITNSSPVAAALAPLSAVLI